MSSPSKVVPMFSSGTNDERQIPKKILCVLEELGQRSPGLVCRTMSRNGNDRSSRNSKWRDFEITWTNFKWNLENDWAQFMAAEQLDYGTLLCIHRDP